MTSSPPRGRSTSGSRQPAKRNPDDRPLESILSYRLSRLHFLMGRATATVYADEGLSSHQWKVMSVLYHYAPMSASDIRPWVTFDKSAISHAVQQLLKAGLVERRLHESDGRAIYIELTKKGRQISERMTARVDHIQGILFDSIPAKQLSVLFPLFDKLDARLHSVIDEDVAGNQNDAG
jgi:DNA-binding MarR family transcriptional regulator